LFDAALIILPLLQGVGFVHRQSATLGNGVHNLAWVIVRVFFPNNALRLGREVASHEPQRVIGLAGIFVNDFTGGVARQKNGCLAVGLSVASGSIVPLRKRAASENETGLTSSAIVLSNAFSSLAIKIRLKIARKTRCVQ
jgi:hypothetical protein